MFPNNFFFFGERCNLNIDDNAYGGISQILQEMLVEIQKICIFNRGMGPEVAFKQEQNSHPGLEQ